MPRRALALLLAVATSACGGPRTPAASAPAPAEDKVPAFTPIPDASTLAIVRMANNVQVAYAIIAARRATSSSVKALVRREQKSHTALNAAVERIATLMEVEPHEGDVSRLLYEQSLPRRDSLRALAGHRFDSAYVDLEVRSHRELLIAIDRVFLRSVQHPELESYLTDSLRPAVSEHLEQAERLQSTLTSRQ